MKNANIKEQKEADILNKTQEIAGKKQIAQLTTVRDENQKVLNAAIEHTTFLTTEMKDTVTYLAWIETRFVTLADQKKQLAEDRCDANQMFVKAVKEHRDAEDVIELLIKDLAGYSSEKKLALAQVSDFSSQLATYSHLF